MDNPTISMHSEAQLKELLEIRSQMTALQARYDEVLRATVAPQQVPATHPSPPAASVPTPAPIAPIAVPATPSPAPAAPAPAPAAPIATPVAPTPTTVASAPAPSAPIAALTPTVTTSPAAAARPSMTPKVDAEPTAPLKVAGTVTSNVRQALVTVLTQAGKPLPFNTIYSKLQATGIELPAVKPMLVVRKLLHDTSLFAVAKGGQFQIKPADDGSTPAPQAAPVALVAPVAPTPAPAQAPHAAPTPAASPVPSPAATTPVPAASPAPVTPVAPAPVTPVAPAAPQPVPAQSPASSFSSKLDSILNQ